MPLTQEGNDYVIRPFPSVKMLYTIGVFVCVILDLFVIFSNLSEVLAQPPRPVSISSMIFYLVFISFAGILLLMGVLPEVRITKKSNTSWVIKHPKIFGGFFSGFNTVEVNSALKEMRAIETQWITPLGGYLPAFIFANGQEIDVVPLNFKWARSPAKSLALTKKEFELLGQRLGVKTTFE
jgi:hypothetical protein